MLKKIFISLGGSIFLRIKNRTPRILFWHGVDLSPDRKIEAESINIDDFVKQVKYLQRYYKIISIDEFYERFQNNSLNKKEVVLTFDDGYANNLRVVLPILSEMKLPFTVFVSTEHIETGELFPTSIARLILFGSGLKKVDIPFLGFINKDISDEVSRTDVYHKVLGALKTRPLNEVKNIVSELKACLSEQEYDILTKKYCSLKPMNWDEVKKLHQSGATIGSHCKYHICCHENQAEQEVKSQIIESKHIIEKRLHDECNYFAYPNGDYTSVSNSFVRKAGYLMGFSTEKDRKIQYGNDISIVPRIGVPFNINTFKIFINLYPRK